MLIAVLSGFVLAITAPWFVRMGRGWAGWLLSLFPVALIAYFSSFIPQIAGGESVLFRYDWAPSLGIDLSFHLDGLSLLFALLITGIGLLVLVYTGTYLEGSRQLGRFFAFLLVFMASMLGLVLADNMVLLFVFWELTSMSSFFLIGFNHDREASRTAALQALLVTSFGGLVMLVGFLLLGQAGGSLHVSALLGGRETITAHPLYLPILGLICAGAFTKSAQVPFHFWLPNAMEAPTPVSAYLHSATMVKGGVYLLARLNPVLGGTPAWELVLATAGTATMLIGAYLALVHTDMKRILAYSTVSALGMMVVMLGVHRTLSIQAAIVFLLAHAFYKGALFLAAGIVDHETGTRDVDRLGGLLRTMPLTALGTALAAFSSAGIPPHLGFIGKELIYRTAFQEPAADILVGVVLLTNISFVAVAIIVGFRPFFRRGSVLPRTPHEPPASLWFGPFLLAALGLIVGLETDLIEGWLIAPAVAAVERKPVAVELALWHGFDTSLLLSAAAFTMGVGLYFGWPLFRRAAARLDHSAAWGPERWYQAGMAILFWLARLQTRILQSGHLHFYLLIVVAATVGLVGPTLLHEELSLGLSRWTDARAHELVLAAIILAATVVVVRSQSLIVAVVSLGVVGFGVAMFFILFSAPDLAMAQFAIEVLSVIFLVMVIFRLPEYQKYSRARERLRDALPALAAGAMMTLLVLAVTVVSREARLVSYYAEHSFLSAKGRNVVNVILVDFRGLDTLGEITVLAVAAIGVYSLLKLYLKKDE